MSAEFLKVRFNFDVHEFNQFFDATRLNTFGIWYPIGRSKIGDVIVENVFQDSLQETKTHSSPITPNLLKRTSMTSIKTGKSQKLNQPNQLVSKDVGQVFKDLNLVPNVSAGDDELQCALCSYRAGYKSHLKTHYKLKHLGGADLTVSCSICKKRCTTKSNLRSHIVSFHKMSRDDAVKLTS